MRASRLPILGLAAVAGCQPRWDNALTELSNPDPERRVEAVRQVAHTGSPDDVASLVFRVNDPDPEVRGAIAEALGALDNPQSADALATLAGDSSESVQLKAVEILARARSVAAHRYLLFAYQRDGPVVRARIAELLRMGGGSPAEAVTAEADALYARYSRELASSGAVRLTAAERLGASGRPEAIERLTTYLAAESRSLALAAARGLGASNSPEALGPLEALLNEDDPALRLAGADALGELGDPEAANALLRALPPSDLVAQAALRSLVRLAQLEGERVPRPPDQARLRLCDAALTPDPVLALQAALAIRKLGIACSAEKLRAHLAHGGEAAGALAAIAVLWTSDGTSKVAGAPSEPDVARLSSVVGSLLRNGTSVVRPLAARVAGALRLAALASDLERARKDAEVDVRRARERWVKTAVPTAAAIPDAGDPAVAATDGQPSLFSEDPPAALSLWAEASAAQVRLALPSSAALLQTLLHDPAAVARAAAAETIPSLSVSDQWRVLVPLLEDAEPKVRAAALAQLPRLDLTSGEAAKWMLAELTRTISETSAAPLMEALSRQPAGPGIHEALAAALERPETAPAAVRALARIGDPPALGTIVEHLRQPYALALPELLMAVAQLAPVLAPADASAAIAASRTLLFHTRPEVRAAAVRAVLALGGPAAIGEVLPLAGDYDLRVRRAVAQR